MQTYITTDDITKIVCDVIVNSGNTEMKRGGGIDKAIHEAAGPEFMEECKKVHASLGRDINPGEVAVLKGHDLPARYIFYTVGPIVRGFLDIQGAAVLGECYTTSIRTLLDMQLKHIVFPAISCGGFGCTVEEALPHVKTAVGQFSTEDIQIGFCLYGEKAEHQAKVYQENLQDLL